MNECGKKQSTVTNVVFDGVTFVEDGVDFAEVRFQGIADFRDAKFRAGANFAGASFAEGSSANFKQAQFENDDGPCCDFSRCKFAAPASFFLARFNSPFFRAGGFSEAEFAPGTCFHDTRFSGQMFNFNGALLHGVRFGIMDASEASLHFYGAKIDRNTSFDAAIMPNTKGLENIAYEGQELMRGGEWLKAPGPHGVTNDNKRHGACSASAMVVSSVLCSKQSQEVQNDLLEDKVQDGMLPWDEVQSIECWVTDNDLLRHLAMLQKCSNRPGRQATVKMCKIAAILQRKLAAQIQVQKVLLWQTNMTPKKTLEGKAAEHLNNLKDVTNGVIVDSMQISNSSLQINSLSVHASKVANPMVIASETSTASATDFAVQLLQLYELTMASCKMLMLRIDFDSDAYKMPAGASDPNWKWLEALMPADPDATGSGLKRALQDAQEKLEKGDVDTVVQDFVKAFTQTCKGSLERVKRLTLDAVKAHIGMYFNNGYTQLQKCSKLKQMWCALTEFDPSTLHEHLDEIEQHIELLKGVFDLEVKAENLDEVAAKWRLLYESTQQLQSRTTYRIITEYLWSDAAVLRGLFLVERINGCVPPYPDNAVREFKVGAAAKLQKSYMKLIRELNNEATAIRRIQQVCVQIFAVNAPLLPIPLPSMPTAHCTNVYLGAECTNCDLLRHIQLHQSYQL
jgi:hypothetical protein